jgi:hypothetical protein
VGVEAVYFEQVLEDSPEIDEVDVPYAFGYFLVDFDDEVNLLDDLRLHELVDVLVC